MVKSAIKWLLRSLGLMQVADHSRYLIMKIRMRSKNMAFRKQHPSVAIPPDYLLYESFQLDYQRYYVNGQKTAQWLADLVQPFMQTENLEILDWGCGPARVLRHLPQIFPAASRCSGTDYNQKTIEWCQENLPDIDFSLNQLMPPLPFTDASFDLVYGISIFTHLSEPAHQAWMQEMIRILKPNGVLFQTLHGSSFRQKLTSAETIQFDRGELVTRGQVKEGHRTFVAFHPQEFVQKWTSALSLLKHIPGAANQGNPEQDVWIWRKI